MLTDLQYIHLFDSCKILPARAGEVSHIVSANIIPNRKRYEQISNLLNGRTNQRSSCFIRDIEDLSVYSSATQRLYQSSVNVNTINTSSAIPWYFIACVHYRESTSNFNKHLHNGDPLSNYTKQHPANRPQVGHKPPFTFEESAADALRLRKLDKESLWTLPKILARLEQYNGIAKAYETNHINSPYLWGGSNLYTKGGFPRDHYFSLNYVNKQLGVAVILKELEQRGIIFMPRS